MKELKNITKIHEINGRTVDGYKDLLRRCDALQAERDDVQGKIDEILDIFRKFFLEYAKYNDNKKYDVSDFAELFDAFNKWAFKHPTSY